MKRILLASAVAVALWSGGALAQQGSYVVLFPFDQATLDAAAQATISAAADEFRKTGSVQISVKGHTDTSGNPDYNQALSQRREQAVTNALVALGVPAAAISSAAVGETEPAVQTGDNVKEAQNRRVDIQVAPPPPPPPAPAPAPAPVTEAPPPPPAPTPWIFTTGLYYGYTFGDQQGHNGNQVGLNLSLDYKFNDWVSVGAEQAGFYRFDTHDDGAGGRTVIGPDFWIGDIFYVGANVGYLYGGGINDSGIAGPEVGMLLDFVNWKIAYDIPFDGGIDHSVINTTLGLSFRF